MKKSIKDVCCTSAILVVAGLSQLELTASLAADEPPPEDQIVVVVEGVKEGGSESQDKQSQPAAPKLWIGIVLKEIQGDLATYLQNAEGVFVDAVLPDSPAQKAGIEVGDILLTAGNQKLARPADLLSIIQSLKTDGDEPQSLEITLLRHGTKKELKVTPAARPQSTNVMKIENKDDDAIVIDGESSQSFSFSLSGDDSTQEVNEFVQKLREGRVNKEMNIYRFGNPSIVWNSDQATGKLTGDIEIKIVKDVDGQNLECTVTRKDDQPAEIQVKKGDELTEYTEESLDELPAELRDLLRPMLSEKKGRVQALRIRPGDGGEARIEGRFQVLRPNGAEARVGELLTKELAEKYKLMAQEMAERSREKAEELANVARESAQLAEQSIRDAAGMPKELEELRKLVNELRQEVKQLREELNQDKDL
jgi:hypothetical protein